MCKGITRFVFYVLVLGLTSIMFLPTMGAALVDPCSGGTLAYWPMEEGSGNSIQDICNGLNGTWTQGVSWATDAEGPYLQFNRGNEGERITINNAALSQNTSITVELRMMPGQDRGSPLRVISQMGPQNGGQLRFILDYGGSRLNVWGATGGVEFWFCGTGHTECLPAGQWTHVAFQINDTQVWLYYNGVLVHSDTMPFPQTLRATNAATEIGTGEQIFGFDGKIQFVRISSGIRNDFLLTRTLPNQPPVANDDSATTDEDTPANINVTANDSDPDGNLDPSTVSIVTPPANGTATPNGDGTITYTPSLNFNGTDTLTYQVCDTEAACDSATVTITVNPVNDSPVVVANQLSATVDEGQTASNSGTVSDVEGDSVTLTASVGTATNNGNGTWSWSFPTTDGPPQSQTVTITGNDGNEGTGQATFNLTVNNVAPTVNAGADQTVNEGDVVNISGSFTDPGSGDTHTIEWNLGDGATVSGILNPTHVYADNGVYTVTLTVTDDDGGVGSDTLIVTVNNVAPTLNAGADLTANEGSSVTFSGSFTDPGSADTHNIQWNFSEGEPASGTLNPTHVYADNGVYTVTLTVTDDDGGVGNDTLIVTVNNVAPDVNPIPNATIRPRETFQLIATFFDPGANDTHPTTINWGDGTPIESGAVNETTDTVTASHRYTGHPQPYNVTVCVFDNYGEMDCETFTVTVQPGPPN